ncbi:EamA-like transporter family protein [bacterium A37T11]|nr:EamA-like transporter family protein [bacterium A37T11]
MIYVLLSVLCSVSVSVVIKLARRYSVDVQQMIIWNYPAAVLLTGYFLHPDPGSVSWNLAPTLIYLALAVLLPGIFVATAQSIRYTGMVRTEVAQRLSLFLPLIAAFTIFQEKPEPLKILGIVVGIAAIVCSINWKGGKSWRTGSKNSWLYPLIVFAGMGLIDVLFKQIALNKAVPYTTSMFLVFFLAMLAAGGYLAYLLLVKKRRFSVSGMCGGLILGAFNFCNILFYMKAHRAIAGNPSLVFSGVNIGVIVFGTLVGVFIFREKLSLLNKIGLVLAVVSVLIIYFLRIG